jgi:hypothetical protein
MGVDETTIGLHAKDGPPVDLGGMAVPITLYTMAPAATIEHLVAFRMQKMRTLTFHDYTDFLRRCRWKLYQKRNRMEQVGNYLCTLDWRPPTPHAGTARKGTSRCYRCGDHHLHTLAGKCA